MVEADSLQSYLDDVPAEHRATVDRLRGLIFDIHPEAEEVIKWNRPVYAVDGTDRFYIDHFTNHVSLGFMQGATLADPEGLLEGTGKQMRHVKITDVSEFDDPALSALVTDAV